MPGVGVGVRMGVGARRRPSGLAAGVGTATGVGDFAAFASSTGIATVLGAVAPIGASAGVASVSGAGDWESGGTTPTVSLTSPAGSSTHIKETALTITVSGACTDSTSVELFASVDGAAYASWGTDATVGGGTWEVVRTIQAGDVGAVNLRATATGAGGTANSAVVAITVRNWNPADLGAKLIDYWQSHEGITLNGSDVSLWEGRANSVDLAQSSAALQPAYDSDNKLNGRSVLSPAGAEAMTLAAGHGLSGTEKAFLAMVVKNANTTDSMLIEGGAGIASADGLILGQATGAAGRVNAGCNGAGSTNYSLNTFAAITTGAWMHVVAQFDTTTGNESGSATYRKDGSPLDLFSEPGNGAPSGKLGNNAHTFFARNNGSARLWTGLCAAIVLGKDALTAGELALLEDWMDREYFP